MIPGGGSSLPRRPEAGRVAVTGAAGKLGTLLRPALAEAGYFAALTDIRPVSDRRASETFTRARLSDGRKLRRAMRGASSLLHLGGAALEGPWETLIAANVAGLASTLEAARAESVTRIVFASSMHAVGMHPRAEPLAEDCPPAPDSRYGATKVFGEGACRLMAEKFGMTVIVLRIGQVVERMEDAAAGEGIAAEDLTRLVLLALGIDEPGYHLFHAVAPHAGYPTTDGRLERRFGFQYRHEGPPRDELLARVAADRWLDDLGRERRGGWFAGRR